MHHTRINFLEPEKPAEQEIPNNSTIPENNPRNNRRIIFIILVIILLILIGGCLKKTVLTGYAPNDPSAYDPITLKPKAPPGILEKIKYFISGEGNNLIGYNQDRINILLLGIGGTGHDGPQLTDTIIILSIQPSTNKLALISIPRDLAVDIPGYGIKKINNANAYGESKKVGSGPEFTKQIIDDIFNINIPYYTRIDFQAFEKIIDDVGGITVEVDKSFTDNMYPNNSENGYETIIFEKGIQNMDGKTALKFARSRHGNNGEGSDFARAKRQQKMLLALKEKMLSAGTLSNPFKIGNIINDLRKNINTNIDFGDIMTFLRIAKNLDTKEITNVVLDDGPNGYLKSTTGQDGAFLLVPIEGTFEKINNLIDNIFTSNKQVINNTPTQTNIKTTETATHNIEIINGTWKAGLAARMKSNLEEKNFLIDSIGNAEMRPQPLSGIYQIKPGNLYNTLVSLQQELHIPIKEKLPSDIKPATSTDILILLGEDMQE